MPEMEHPHHPLAPAAPPSSEGPAWHRLTAEAALASARSTPAGLTSEEAGRRLAESGPNELRPASNRLPWRHFLAQFTHLMAVLLWIGAALAMVIRLPQLAVAIVAVILINGAFSYWQEYRAEKATAELSRLLPQAATVLRGGVPTSIPAADVVTGDILVLSEGDQVPADARLLDAHLLSTNDSALTGESAAVPRRAEALGSDPAQSGEATNCVYAGTTVASGRGIALVTATGPRTAFGAIARLAGEVRDRPSPLQRELNVVVRTISLVAVGIGVVFTLLAVVLVRVDAAAALTFALGLIVAFVPEGLLPTMTLSLAMGVQRMAKRQALVKHLSAVEALGAATVIATDKTGVLTKNEMFVSSVFVVGRQVEITGTGYSPTGEFRVGGVRMDEPLAARLRPLLRAAALCNYSRLQPPASPTGDWTVLGDPTEGALQVLAAKGGIRVEELMERRRLSAEWPFDAVRQRMTVAYPAQDGDVALTKGNPTAVLSRCTDIADGEGWRALTEGDRDAILAAVQGFATVGLRVLALAQRPISHAELDNPPEEVEQRLQFLGLAAMQDPPRDEIADAVHLCRKAGIRTVIISGDQGSTAVAIGRQVGIVTVATPRVIEGPELIAMNEEEIRAALESGGEIVFARTPPEGKLRVVKALQASGHIVAVTGDGVNDAPALRQADIGVAMGRSGTDVARASADIVLADDNFASIVAAIQEGRAVFDNIRKFTTYCFTSNTAEAVPFILFLLSAGHVPLALPIMLVLAVDLGTDMFPAIALGAEAAEPDVMSRPPRQRGSHLISPALLLRSLVWLGLLEGIAGMASFFWVYGMDGHPADLGRARAATFAGIVAAQIANVFVCRSDRGLAFGRAWNHLLPVGIGLELALLGAVVYVPWFQRAFETSAMTPRDWVVPLAVLPLFFLVEETRKWMVRSAPFSRNAVLTRGGSAPG